MSLIQTPEQKQQLLGMLDEKIRRLEVDAARGDLLDFAGKVYPNYAAGGHHKRMAALFKDIAEGRKKRVIINIAPRMGKSELTSYLLPAWYLGLHPDHQIIMATHTASLSEDFGGRVRNLVNSAEYREIFPDTRLAEDKKGAGSWNTQAGGKYYAVGVGGALAGRGANLLVIDDPHSEQDLKSGSKLPFEQAWSWYQTGPRQRLMWGGAIIVVMTRWGAMDLSAKLLDYQARNPDADQWEVVEFPAILPSGRSLWPEKWPIEELLRTKATIQPRFWNAQYMQNPTSDEVALIKRGMWRTWEPERPPTCDFIIQSWDTAHETKTSSDYSACTTWGVFFNEDDNSNHIILLNAFKDRMEFPELKSVAYKHYMEWEPDSILIEKKAAGAPLIQEFRQMGLPVEEFTPSRGNDKTVRVNAVAPIFEGGKVWAPGTRWANEVIEELASFPVGENDDYVDTCLVGATRVRMRDGSEKRLDDVRVGDWVATPLGAQPVTATFDQGQREVWEVDVDGTRLIGTGDHQICTCFGWIRVDKLRPGVDTVVLYRGEPQWSLVEKMESAWSVLCSTGKRTLCILTAQILRTVLIFPEPGTAFTGMSGLCTTGLSRQDATFTTLTATQATTTLAISSALPARSTGPCTRQNAAPAGVPPSTLSTWIEFGLKLLRGMPQTKGVRGIERLPKNRCDGRESTSGSLDLPTWRARVLGAGRRLLGRIPARSFAARNARQRSRNSGVVRAVRNTHTTQRVYDISVAGEHCFYANGVLVHNCSQALIRFRQGHFIRLDSDMKDEPRKFRSSRHAAYY